MMYRRKTIVISIILTLHACMHNHVQLFATSRTVACQAPLFIEFSRQKYWSGLPFSPPEDLSIII